MVTLQERHDGHARLESGETEGEFREEQCGGNDHVDRVAKLFAEGTLPVEEHFRALEHVDQADSDDDGVEDQVTDHEDNCNADGFVEPLQEDGTENGDQEEGDRYAGLVEVWSQDRIFHQVGGGIGGREGDGDDEVCGSEAKQEQDEGLAPPPGKETPEHEDRSLTVGAFIGDLLVDGQRAEECHDDEDDGGDWRERTGSDECDARLVPEG